MPKAWTTYLVNINITRHIEMNCFVLKGSEHQAGRRRTHLDDWLLGVVATGVLSVPAPIPHIDLWHPRQQELLHARTHGMKKNYTC